MNNPEVPRYIEFEFNFQSISDDYMQLLRKFLLLQNKYLFNQYIIVVNTIHLLVINYTLFTSHRL